LQQVLLNLLRNAVTHTPPGGVVAILAGDEDETVRIEIRDTGEGIGRGHGRKRGRRKHPGPGQLLHHPAAGCSAGIGISLPRPKHSSPFFCDKFATYPRSIRDNRRIGFPHHRKP
jgi:hypothetical protein